MAGPFSSTDIPVQFFERSDETAVVGHESHQLDSTRLFTELQFVVTTALDDDAVSAVEGVIFHTENPVIANWRVDAD